MKDPRFAFDAAHGAWQERRFAAQALRFDLGEVARLESALVAGFREAFATDRPVDFEALISGVVRRLKEQPPTSDATDGLLGAIAAILRGKDRVDATTDRARLLVGRCFGLAMADAVPSGRVADEPRSAIGSDPMVYEALEEAFLEGCGGQSDAREAWTRYLSQVPPRRSDYFVPWHPDLGDDDPRVIVRANDLWGRFRAFVPLDHVVMYRLHLLLLLSPAALFDALATIPSHLARQSVIELLRLCQHPDVLIEELRRSAPAYSEGKWTGATIAVLILPEIVNYAAQLYSAVQMSQRQENIGAEPSAAALNTLRQQELPEWFRRAWAALFSRPDHRPLAIEFASHLVRQTDMQRNTPTQGQGWTAEGLALETLIDRLEQDGVTVDEIRSRWRLTLAAGGNWSGLPYVIVSALVDSDRRQRTIGTASAAEVWFWYEEDLAAASEDDVVSFHVNPFGGAAQWVFATLGSVLLAHEDPQARWTQTWERLYRQRERHRFVHYGVEGPDQASVHVFRSGCWALALRPPTESKDKERKLWHELLRRGRYLTFGQGPHDLRGIVDLTTLFAFVPTAFGDQWREALKECEGLFQSGDEIALTAIYLLTQNGLQPASLRLFLDEIDLDQSG